MVQWLGICFAMQGTQVQSLLGELRSQKPMQCNEEPVCGNKRSHVSQLRFNIVI